jgi:3-dehydroquinate dehydratase II
MKVLLGNGPNLNLLGTREPAIYGAEALADVETMCRKKSAALGLELAAFQSNHEGQVIDRIHAARDEDVRFVVINPGALTIGYKLALQAAAAKLNRGDKQP